jgi:hypothetical protein
MAGYGGILGPRLRFSLPLLLSVAIAALVAAILLGVSLDRQGPLPHGTPVVRAVGPAFAGPVGAEER